jgi:hypothetical protein
MRVIFCYEVVHLIVYGQYLDKCEVFELILEYQFTRLNEMPMSIVHPTSPNLNFCQFGLQGLFSHKEIVFICILGYYIKD